MNVSRMMWFFMVRMRVVGSAICCVAEACHHHMCSSVAVMLLDAAQTCVNRAHRAMTISRLTHRP